MKYSLFADRLNSCLDELDRSATWLARRLAVHPATVNRWCAGETRPGSPELITRIADVLGLFDPADRQALLCAAGYGYTSSPPAPSPRPLSSPSPASILRGGHPLDLPPPLTARFDQLRQQLRETVASPLCAIALWRLEALEWTFRQQRPDVAWMEANLAWFQRNLPTLVDAFVAILWHPIVVEMLWQAGETTYRTFYCRLGLWQPSAQRGGVSES